LDEKETTTRRCIVLERLKTEKIDVSLPGYQLYEGSIHPLNLVIEDVEDLFIGMGYEIADGPELESDHYNFEMMNLAKDHPCKSDARFFLY
jgi:phenylalanyl-tRNA synthetase alpha chain